MGRPARPMEEEMKAVATVARLPQVMREFKALKREVEELKGEAGE